MGGVIEREGDGVDVLGQRIRPFGPAPAEHPIVGRVCPACKARIAEGDVSCLLVMDSEENRQAAEEADGRAYNAVATPAHWTCLTGSTDPVGDFERYFGRSA